MKHFNVNLEVFIARSFHFKILSANVEFSYVNLILTHFFLHIIDNDGVDALLDLMEQVLMLIRILMMMKPKPLSVGRLIDGK